MKNNNEKCTQLCHEWCVSYMYNVHTLVYAGTYSFTIHIQCSTLNILQMEIQTHKPLMPNAGIAVDTAVCVLLTKANITNDG